MESESEIILLVCIYLTRQIYIKRDILHNHMLSFVL